MNYCPNCGHKVEENSFVCMHCGVKLKDEISSKMSNIADKGGIGWGILGFFVPLAGLILYLLWKEERPKTAKSVGKGAIAYLIFYIILIAVMFIFGFTRGIIEENSYSNDEYYYNFE